MADTKSPENTKTWQNMAISVMTGVLLTGVGAWLTIGRSAVTRAEMNEAMIPQTRQVESIGSKMEAISADMSQIKTQIAVLTQKVETLNEQLRERAAKP